MNLSDFHKAYFIGIGGIGMSALARFLLDQGFEIAGYDKTPGDITHKLKEEGIDIHHEDSIEKIPKAFLTKESCLIVYTPAIPNDHQQLNFFIKQGFMVKKRAELLGMISKDMFTIAVAGTHGKTSTSWMIAHLLRHCKIDCYALLGGISTNYNTNYLSPTHKNCKLLIVEADEYDRSFLQLHPNILIITSIEADHLDIYGNFAELQKAFQELTDHLPQNAKLILSDHIEKIKVNNSQILYSFGLGSINDINAINIRIEEGKSIFDILTRAELLEEIKLNVAGEHNILNALAAFAAVGNSFMIPTKSGMAFFPTRV
jgi:UDP-N-acetylmuramate--alanine ligase